MQKQISFIVCVENTKVIWFKDINNQLNRSFITCIHHPNHRVLTRLNGLSCNISKLIILYLIQIGLPQHLLTCMTVKSKLFDWPSLTKRRELFKRQTKCCMSDSRPRTGTDWQLQICSLNGILQQIIQQVTYSIQCVVGKISWNLEIASFDSKLRT